MKYYKGKFKPKNPEKYVGDANNIVYRSSWELKFMIYCDTNPNVLQYASEEIFIPYVSPVDNKVHRYFPDFLMKVKKADGNISKILVEVKPKSQTKPPVPGKRKTKKFLNEVKTWMINESKWKQAEEFCKDHNMEFMIITEDHLFKYK